MTADRRPYRHLNHDGAWPRFSWSGLDLSADGTLRLIAVPKLDGSLPREVAELDSDQPPGGIAVDRDGTIYFSDSASGLTRRIGGCFGEIEPVPCATNVSEPAALLIPRHRRVLYLADPGNHRIQLFDIETMALVEVLTGFQQPVSIASSDDGSLFVVDTGTRRVDKLTVSGDLVPSWWQAVHSSGRLVDPHAVACDRDLVYVLDRETGHVTIFDGSGQLSGDVDTGVRHPTVLAAASGVVYVGDPERGRITVFRRDSRGVLAKAGVAAGYEGPLAALVADGGGGLLALPGGGMPPLRLTLDAGYREVGWLWSKAIRPDGVEHYWNRLHASIALPAGSHVQFFVATGKASTPPPSPATSGEFALPWRAIACDVTDAFLTSDGTKAEAIWIGARFTNDLGATPALSQIRLDFDQSSYLPYLPAIYREPDSKDFLLRYVSLFESFFDELEAGIASLPALADPAAAPTEGLPWLAGFLAFPLPEVLSESARREAIAGAYTRYARRGTAAGLRDTLRTEAGVHATIDEPLQAMGWWSLPAPSASCHPGQAGVWLDGSDAILGVSTTLVSAEPQGAVVGTTATLDRSHLISQEEYGTPLFDEAAYRFTVRLYPGEVAAAGKLDQVKAILDREKPAHTDYEVCVISDGLRIGYQARLGIDTLLGGGPTPGPLGETDLVLRGQPRGEIGTSSHIGVGTRI